MQGVILLQIMEPSRTWNSAQQSSLPGPPPPLGLPYTQQRRVGLV